MKIDKLNPDNLTKGDYIFVALGSTIPSSIFEVDINTLFSVLSCENNILYLSSLDSQNITQQISVNNRHLRLVSLSEEEKTILTLRGVLIENS